MRKEMPQDLTERETRLIEDVLDFAVEQIDQELWEEYKRGEQVQHLAIALEKLQNEIKSCLKTTS